MIARTSAVMLLALCTASLAQVTADDITWDFECGSLTAATTRSPNNIALQIRLDPGPPDLYGWYDFRVVQHAAGQTVTFAITNPDNWMTDVCRPVLSYDGNSWERAGEAWMQNGELRFRHTFAQDSVEVALVFPLRYSDLLFDLTTFLESPLCTLEVIGHSVHGRAIPLLMVTDPSVPLHAKRCVWIISRQHPMETPPYFILRSMLENLTGAQEPDLGYLLRRTVFRIIPLVNVDGAAEGFSRHNANGINLNRNWTMDSTHSGEEPEVEAVHGAIEDWLAQGQHIDLFLDMHAAPDLYDFGYRLSEAYSSPSYYRDSHSFLTHLAGNDTHQHPADWRDLDENYGTGLSVMSVYQRRGTPVFSSENSWTRRADGQYITIAGLEQEGAGYARAIEDYLFPVAFTDPDGSRLDSFAANAAVFAQVYDPDENENPFLAESLAVSFTSSIPSDTEDVWLVETGSSTGSFRSAMVLAETPGLPYNGELSVQPGATVRAIYRDDDFAPDSSWTDARIAGSSRAGTPPSPATFALTAFPNPFNAVTSLIFDLPQRQHVRIAVYDITGRVVEILADAGMTRGHHTMYFDGSRLASGMYLARVEGDQSATLKLMLMK